MNTHVIADMSDPATSACRKLLAQAGQANTKQATPHALVRPTALASHLIIAVVAHRPAHLAVLVAAPYVTSRPTVKASDGQTNTRQATPHAPPRLVALASHLIVTEVAHRLAHPAVSAAVLYVKFLNYYEYE